MKKFGILLLMLAALAVVIESCGPPKDMKGHRKKKTKMGWI